MIDPIELHAWADGEVDPGREAAVRCALAESVEARAELESILALKSFLRSHSRTVECSAQWRTCVGRLNELDRTRRVERLASGKLAWGLSVVLFAVILAAGYLHRGSDPSRVSGTDLARMFGTFSHIQHPSGAIENQEFYKDLLDKAKFLAAPHLTLEGRDSGELDGRPATLFEFHDATGEFGLIVVPNVWLAGYAGVPEPRNYRSFRLNGKNSVAWSSGQGTLLVSGDRSFADLAAVADGFH